MPDILSTLLGGAGNQGLLSPEQQGDVTGQGLMSMGAAMLKAAGPSPYKGKMTTLSGLGEGIQAGITGRNTAMNNVLNQQLVRTNMLDKILPILTQQAKNQAYDVPTSPEFQKVLEAATRMLGVPSNGVRTGVPGIGSGPPGAAVQPGGDAITQKARELNMNPGRGMFGDPNFNKRLEERLHSDDPTFAAQKDLEETSKHQADSYNKQYQALQGLGRESAGISELMDQANAIMDRPDFRSSTGFGSEIKELYKNFKATFGGDPNEAFTPQAFRKVFSEALQARIESARLHAQELGPAGRQLLANVNIMGNASPKTDITEPTNRYLANQTKREAQRNMLIANEATKYAQASPRQRLDLGWDTHLSNLMAKNPIYAPRELEGMKDNQIPGMPAQPAVPPAPPGAVSGPAPIPGAIGPAGSGAAPPGAMRRQVAPNGAVRYLDAQGNVIGQ